MKLSALEIAKEKLERPDRLLGDVDERILAGAVVELTYEKCRELREHLETERAFAKQSQALKEAEEILKTAVSVECLGPTGDAWAQAWLAKYGEKK